MLKNYDYKLTNIKRKKDRTDIIILLNRSLWLNYLNKLDFIGRKIDEIKIFEECNYEIDFWMQSRIKFNTYQYRENCIIFILIVRTII
jgi:hypothetical protein